MPVAAARPRLADVAAAAGTSKPIASRVLNGDPTLRVGAELRERVQVAARELGYHPHALARSLRSAQTGAVGFVIPTLTNPVFAVMLHGAVREARDLGYAVLLSEERPGDDDVFAQLVLGGRIDGLMVATAREGLPLLDDLRRFEIPHVFVNRAVAGSSRNVVPDDATACRIAARHLHELGHRRIGHVSAPVDLEPGRRRVDAFRDAVVGLGLDPPRLVVQPTLEDEEGVAAAEAVLDTGVTAVFTDTPGLGLCVLHAARRRGTGVPGAVSVLALNDVQLVDMYEPPLTTIALPMEELGRTAVRLLVDQLGGAGPRDALVADPAPALIPRRSTGPAPA
ncbi:MAG: LacI family DNA-binding transcriptional regulator [Pseudonocardia sp.]